MRGDRVTLQTTVDGAEALHQLRENTTAPVGGWIYGSKEFFCSFDGNEFELWRRRSWGRNDLAPHFFGRLIPQAGACRIEGHFDTGSWARIFLNVWVAVA